MIGAAGNLKRLWIHRANIGINQQAGNTERPVVCVKPASERRTTQAHQIDLECHECGCHVGSFVYDPDRGPTLTSGARLWFETRAIVREATHPRTNNAAARRK